MSAGKVQTSITLIGSPPWGFRLSGGKEYNQPLVITRLTPGSLAARSGVNSGDVLVAINGAYVGDLSQDECEAKVRQASGSLHLVLQKNAAKVTEHGGGQVSVEGDRSVYNTTDDIQNRVSKFNKTARPFNFGNTEPQPKVIQAPNAPSTNGFKSVGFQPKKSPSKSTTPTSPQQKNIPVVQSSTAQARHNIAKAIPSQNGNASPTSPTTNKPVNVSQYNSKPAPFNATPAPTNGTIPTSPQSNGNVYKPMSPTPTNGYKQNTNNSPPPDFVTPPQSSYVQNKYSNPNSNSKLVIGNNTPIGLYSSENAQICYEGQIGEDL